MWGSIRFSKKRNIHDGGPIHRKFNTSVRKYLKSYLMISNIMNRCQELVEFDLLIYTVPGFVSIRSLGAEIRHFVSALLHFQGNPLVRMGFHNKTIRKTNGFIRKSIDFKGPGHKM